MREASKFIGGPTGGITSDIFALRFRDREYFMDGRSGRRLRVQVTGSRVNIQSAEDRKVLFSASADNGSLNLSSYTIEETGARHPDLYPRQLVEQSYHYLTGNGNTIEVITGRWVPPDFSSINAGRSVNYEAFTSQLAGIQDPTDDDKVRAAQNTWTGQVAASLGFTNVRDVDMNGGPSGKCIVVEFAKPEERQLELAGDEEIYLRYGLGNPRPPSPQQRHDLFVPEIEE